MVALASLFVVVLVSLLVTRIGTVALALTGMSEESARFQARSAFFGVGFTTQEAESVVGHPVRRRIVMGLMLAGNAGAVTGIASLVLCRSCSRSRAGARATARSRSGCSWGAWPCCSSSCEVRGSIGACRG